MVCKRLDVDDAPVVYLFSQLTPRQILTLAERMFRSQAHGTVIEILDMQDDGSNELAALFKASRLVRSAEPEEALICVVLTADESAAGTEVRFHYFAPEHCCDIAPVVSELTGLIHETLNMLSAMNSAIAAHRSH